MLKKITLLFCLLIVFSFFSCELEPVSGSSYGISLSGYREEVKLIMYFIVGILLGGSIGICIGVLIGSAKFESLYRDEQEANEKLKNDNHRLRNRK